MQELPCPDLDAGAAQASGFATKASAVSVPAKKAEDMMGTI
jgi:hypothetical protein